MKRTNYCGSLREKDLGRTITVMGWVQNKRDMGGVIFIDVRDCMGTLQVVFDAQNLSTAEFSAVETVKIESTVSVTAFCVRAVPKPIIPSLKPAQSNLQLTGSRCCQKPIHCLFNSRTRPACVRT